MKCKLTKRMQVSRGHPFKAPRSWLEIGYIQDTPTAYKLVRMGCAVPFDDECRIAAGMTDAEIKKAQQTQAHVAKGIDVRDREAFNDGEMTGYDGKGRKIPGPNADEEYAEEYADLIEDEQDEEDESSE